MEPSFLRVAIDGPIQPADIPALCDRFRARLIEMGGRPVVCDVGAVTSPDAAAVDVLARFHLIARRLGFEVCFTGASAELVDLLALAGLARVLPLTDC